MLADMLRKGLTHNKFLQHRDLVEIREMFACEWKGMLENIHSFRAWLYGYITLLCYYMCN